MPEHDMPVGKEGIGTPSGGIPLRNLRIELDATLRRYGFTDGLAALDRIPGQGASGTALADLVRAEDHQRLSAPDRDTMRRAALAATGHERWTEQQRGAFLAFIMKGTLPGPGGTWLLPFASWAEAAQSFGSLYADARVWDEWWREVQ